MVRTTKNGTKTNKIAHNHLFPQIDLHITPLKSLFKEKKYYFY